MPPAVRVLWRLLALSLAIVGLRYVVLGIAVVLNLPTITADWVRASGDQDFVRDFALFFGLFLIGAVWLATLGAATAWESLRMLLARPGAGSWWPEITIAALMIHPPLLVYRAVGGLWSADGQAVVWEVVWLAALCAAYVAVWIARTLESRLAAWP